MTAEHLSPTCSPRQSKADLETSGRHWSQSRQSRRASHESVRSRPKFGQHRSTWADFAPKIGRTRLNIADIAPNLPKSHETCRSRTKLAEIGRNWPKSHETSRSRTKLAEFVRNWPMSPESAKCGANCGIESATGQDFRRRVSAQTLTGQHSSRGAAPRHDHAESTLREICHKLSLKSSGHFQSPQKAHTSKG